MTNTSGKICVYAICKNESKFIDRWVESLEKEADCVVVLDTGSTDDSVEKLKTYEPFVTVQQFDYIKKFGHFRFDQARNDSMKLIPFDTDICVILDLDHVPRPGWGNILREKFKEGYNLVTGYIVDHSEGGELPQWRSKNVHSNSPKWTWENIIHEGIVYYGDKNEIREVFCEDFIIDHYPDENKDRSMYRELLEYAFQQEPTNPHYGIYLGVELSRRYSVEAALQVFEKCLDQCNFTGHEDIEMQVRMNIANIIAESDHYEAIEQIEYILDNLGFKYRRIYNRLGEIYDNIGDYDEAIASYIDALSVQSYSGDWKDDYELFTGIIEDKISLLYYYQKNDIFKAIEWEAKALGISPNDKRLQSNMNYYIESYYNRIEMKKENSYEEE